MPHSPCAPYCVPKAPLTEQAASCSEREVLPSPLKAWAVVKHTSQNKQAALLPHHTTLKEQVFLKQIGSRQITELSSSL